MSEASGHHNAQAVVREACFIPLVLQVSDPAKWHQWFESGARPMAGDRLHAVVTASEPLRVEAKLGSTDRTLRNMVFELGFALADDDAQMVEQRSMQICHHLGQTGWIGGCSPDRMALRALAFALALGAI